ncbi:HIT family protein [Chromobacterium violaceum]|uniref:HIT family protein n=1 Tax=Chromobacterium violaceum TaxID=536 RepID=UPI001E42F7F6|nr:HIT family protein [Chromobacterium violaceum]MCD0494618.1 HIT family protein [Chromobacterium violaceum]
MACLGCRLANGREAIHTVYEDDFVTCLLDHDPFSEGHTLIIPKRHAVELEELDAPLAKAVMEASQIVSRAIKLLYRPDGITICQNGGVFNELTHFHLHVVPRTAERPFSEFWSAARMNPQSQQLSRTREMLSSSIAAIIACQ